VGRGCPYFSLSHSIELSEKSKKVTRITPFPDGLKEGSILQYIIGKIIEKLKYMARLNPLRVVIICVETNLLEKS
jgi:hypothetical protein